jgi:RNA-splicing ligase RtcB
MFRLAIIPILIFLAGCGVDAVGTAAVNAEAKAREIEQAQKLKENVERQLNDAAAIERRRLEEMDAAMEQGRGEANQ